MHPVMHYRLCNLLFNFVNYWLFVMLLPHQVLLDFSELLKVRQCSGAWNVFVAACGESKIWYKQILNHLGMRPHESKSHPDIVNVIRDEFIKTLFGRAICNTVSIAVFQSYEAIWIKHMPEPYKHDMERARLVKWLMIYCEAVFQFPEINALKIIDNHRYRTRGKKKFLQVDIDKL